MNTKNEIRIKGSWGNILAEEFAKPYFVRLHEYVRQAYLTTAVYPRPADLFAAFRETPWDSVRVVILGQDPYHGVATREVRSEKGEVRLEQVPQAMGLCFSVRDGVPPPPSLQNIFKQVNSEQSAVNSVAPSTDLTRWARQGVLLLNSVLTVEAGKAGSHASLGKEKNAAGIVEGGWEQFTDAVIQTVSDEKVGVVFLLWGNYARGKKKLIDTKKHLVLEAPHPSPLSAHAGFFGCGHFAKTNDFLHARGGAEVLW